MSSGKATSSSLLNALKQRRKSATRSGRQPNPNPRYPDLAPAGGGRGRGRGRGGRGRGATGGGVDFDPPPSASGDVDPELFLTEQPFRAEREADSKREAESERERGPRGRRGPIRRRTLAASWWGRRNCGIVGNRESLTRSLSLGLRRRKPLLFQMALSKCTNLAI